MSVLIHIVQTQAELDGTTALAYGDATWSVLGTNYFRGIVATDFGVVDWRAILEGLEGEFGPFLDRPAPDVGSVRDLTDIALERVVVSAPNATAILCGTHSPEGFAPEQRIRIAPEMMPTETAEVFQAGGTGQVSHTLLANGQAGVLVLPTGLRWFVEGDAGDDEDNEVLAWLVPCYAPADFAQLANAGQPPPQFA